MILIGVLMVLGIFSIVTFELKDLKAVEYPSCLFFHEIKIWDFRIYHQKQETDLSRYIKRNEIDTSDMPYIIFPISEKKYTYQGIERNDGGVGKDILKLNNVIKQDVSKITVEKLCDLLDLLNKNNTAEFQHEVWKLFYKQGE